MPTVTMSMEEYQALLASIMDMGLDPVTANARAMEIARETEPAKRKSKSTKYSRTYKREFRKIAPRFKTKNGKWKKDGFKAAVKAAHRATRKILG